MEEIDIQIEREMNIFKETINSKKFFLLQNGFFFSLLSYFETIRSKNKLFKKRSMRKKTLELLNGMSEEIKYQFDSLFSDIGERELVLGYTKEDLTKSLTIKHKKKLLKLADKFDDAQDKDYKKVFNANESRLRAGSETLLKYSFEKKKDKETSDLGWISVSILDKRTTDVCRRLEFTFYPSKKFKTRNSIPNRPPRHFRCRSMILRIMTHEQLSYVKSLV